ncbi:MAG: cystathionine beta-lyase [Hyphomicrobiales bacterium]
MSKSKPDLSSLSPATRLVAAGRDYAEHGFVNPAVYHGSTVLFPTAASLHDRSQTYVYGRRGTPTSRAVEEAVALVEGGHNAKMLPSGLAAITTALLAFLKSGDHLLMVDTVYQPARLLCDGVLRKLGIETSYYDPLIGRGIAALMRPNTRVVYCESPGSQTMEVQDIAALAEAAHRGGAVAMIDNTWSAGHYFKAFDHGCDVSIQAATKYLVGHSDAMMGTVTCNAETWPAFKEAYESMGQFAGPDDMYLTLRGIHTLDVRLERHMRNATAVAEWLRGRDEVETVLYPALSNAPGHDQWKRDFSGASGLFSIVLKPCSDAAADAFLDRLTLFGMGYSWGGFESLAVPFRPQRTATTWTPPGPCVRFHIGLESPDDLIADLGEGFAALRALS